MQSTLAFQGLNDAISLRERVRADLGAQQELLENREAVLCGADAAREADGSALAAYEIDSRPTLADTRAEIIQIAERVRLATKALAEAGRRVDSARMAASREYLASQHEEIAKLRSRFTAAGKQMLDAFNAFTKWEDSFAEQGFNSIGYEAADTIVFTSPRCVRGELALALADWLKSR